MSSVVCLSPVPWKDRECQLKVSVAKWLSVITDEHGCGDNNGKDKNSWNEHMLWSQIDLGLNLLSFTNCPTIGRVAQPPWTFFFLICKMG